MPAAAAPLAAAHVNAFVALVVGVALFVIVIAVIVVVMVLLQAVLPGTDTEAEAVHARELEAERLEHAGMYGGEREGEGGDEG